MIRSLATAAAAAATVVVAASAAAPDAARGAAAARLAARLTAQRRLQPIADVYIELCAPELGSTDPAFAIVGGLTNMADYRVSFRGVGNGRRTFHGG
jgi:hypothetical protein